MQIIKSIQNRIYELRGERVILDRDLASLYDAPTKVLNLAVKRNIERFPSDFMFQLKNGYVVLNVGSGVYHFEGVKSFTVNAKRE